MTLQSTASSGNPLTINEIKAEFGGPNKITNYYRGGGYVPNHDTNSGIPTSGNIRVLNFLSADKAFRCAITSGTSSISGLGTVVVYYGYKTGSPSFGSILSGATYCGISGSSLTQATLGSVYSIEASVTSGPGTGATAYATYLVLNGGDYSSTATWTSLTLTQIASVTLNRSAATVDGSSGTYTTYSWSTPGPVINTIGTVTVAIA